MKKLKKVLLVDDDDTTNFFNKYLIKKIDASEEILVALNGQEALDVLKSKGENGRSNNPDLILLDINMPIMNGFEFLDAYKELNEDQKANVVICMLSTSLHEDDLLKYKKYEGINDFLSKPLSEEKIINLIEKHFK